MNWRPGWIRTPSPHLNSAGEVRISLPVVLLVGFSLLGIGLILVVPLVALLLRTVPDWLAGGGQLPMVGAALRLSLFTATLTTIIALALGTPLAYLLARYRFPGVEVLDTLVHLPMVLPPAVAGIALLVAFGRTGLVGQLLAPLGITLPFTTAAVIMAQLFVATPFYIRAAKSGFAEVDLRLEQISATLGETPLGTFYRVTLPLARRSLLGGAIMTWARALGEFGATILFAGNLSGRTQTMPLAIYAALQTDLDTALVLAVILLLTSFGVLLLLRLVVK